MSSIQLLLLNIKNSTSLQKELYGMLIAEEIELKGLKDKVGEVNEQNEVVQLAVNSFNDATVKVNVLKEDVFSSLQKGRIRNRQGEGSKIFAFFYDFKSVGKWTFYYNTDVLLY